MTVICDSSALINLALVNQLPLLERMFGSVIIPPGVYEEVVVQGRGEAGADEVAGSSYIHTRLLRPSWDRQTVDVALSSVDHEIIALARQERADLVVTRDRRLARRLRQHGFPAITIAALLVAAKQKGYLASVKETLDLLRSRGVRMRQATYQGVIRQAGE